jgi:Uma2 family endonuclease
VLSDAIATRVSESKLRRPDVTVDCGRAPGSAFESVSPTALFEILSPSTRHIDLLQKPFEYRSVKTLRHFIIVEPSAPVCTVWDRHEDGRWEDQPIIGLESSIELAALGVMLTLAEVYEGVDLSEPA